MLFVCLPLRPEGDCRGHGSSPSLVSIQTSIGWLPQVEGFHIPGEKSNHLYPPRRQTGEPASYRNDLAQAA